MFEARTRDIIVRAEPAFLAQDSNPTGPHYVWAYTIEIENLGAHPVRLMKRRWIITDAQGLSREVRGDGVVGQQPLIAPGESFTYTSSAALSTPYGMMYGAFTMVDDAGAFDADIPAFPLEAPIAPRRIN
jgi:ApaG protein